MVSVLGRHVAPLWLWLALLFLRGAKEAQGNGGINIQGQNTLFARFRYGILLT